MYSWSYIQLFYFVTLIHDHIYWITCCYYRFWWRYCTNADLYYRIGMLWFVIEGYLDFNFADYIQLNVDSYPALFLLTLILTIFFSFLLIGLLWVKAQLCMHLCQSSNKNIFMAINRKSWWMKDQQFLFFVYLWEGIGDLIEERR